MRQTQREGSFCGRLCDAVVLDDDVSALGIPFFRRGQDAHGTFTDPNGDLQFFSSSRRPDLSATRFPHLETVFRRKTRDATIVGPTIYGHARMAIFDCRWVYMRSYAILYTIALAQSVDPPWMGGLSATAIPDHGSGYGILLMAEPCTKPLPLYRPRDPRASDLWCLIDEHFETFQQVYDERFQDKYGYWRPVVQRSVTAFLKCGDLQEGFARVRCPDCQHEMFVAYSCKQRCTCPSCHQKRTLLTSIHVAEDVCFPVAHRQVVFTIPKRLRVHARFDRKLLGKLSSCAWACIKAEGQRMLGRDDVAPGMIAAIQTFGQLLHWNPHIHSLVTCGAFTPDGDFLELSEFDMDSLLVAWQEAVFALYLAEGKIEQEVVENMRSWEHSGFSVDQSVLLSAGDQSGIERLVQYMIRCPFSLSRLIKVTETGQVVYKAEKQACQAFPEQNGDGIASGPKRNFQILSPLDFLAEFTQHIPPKGSHTIRYYGFYSNKSRGMRKKAEEGAEPPSQGDACATPTARCSQTWAMLIKRVYEVDPLACPRCGGEMKVVAFIDPPQVAVIEKILSHCGLKQPSAPRGPPHAVGLVHDSDSDVMDQTPELTYVDIDTFLATF